MPATLNSKTIGIHEPRQVTFNNLISSLSYALDLTEGAIPGHAVRTCILGMRIGLELGLEEDLLHDLYYSLLLKDVGCSNNSSRLCQIVGSDEIKAKQLTKTVDWTRFQWKQIQYLLKHAHAREPHTRRVRRIADMVRTSGRNAEELIRLRCDRGAKVTRDLGFGPAVAGAIYCLDEHWNGMGYPDRLEGDDIPLLARIVSVAQTFEVFYRSYGLVAALGVLQSRSGRWFDPAIVRAAVSLDRRGALTGGLCDTEVRGNLHRYEPKQRRVLTDSYTIDSICVAFAGVVDAKSPYTFRHSTGVAKAAQQIGECMGLSGRQLQTLRRAGLLHDIGKLSVPNLILDKPGKLTPDEWQCVRQHPHYTHEILRRIVGFEEIALIAASHHEKLDGSGYHLGLNADHLPLLSRILVVADMYDALSGDRPYRERLTLDRILAILRNDTPKALDITCVEALETFAKEYDPCPQ